MEIVFDENNYDIIYNRLYMNQVNSILEENGILKLYFGENEYDRSQQIKKDLIEFDSINPKQILINKFDNHDWNNEWEKTIEPVYIKDRIIIYPSWKKNGLMNTEGKILIEIDPKMSFGTGHNETSQLILELLSDYLTGNEETMFDFGCGTVILAIAGIKLGVKEAVAIDNDADSIENSKENIKINDCEGRIKLYLADISEINENGFDIVAANITSNVIIPNLKAMYDKLVMGGKLFITGILFDEKKELKSELGKNNFLVKEIRDKAEWTSFFAIKK